MWENLWGSGSGNGIGYARILKTWEHENPANVVLMRHTDELWWMMSPK